MTSTKAIQVAIIAIATAILGVIVTAGLDLSQDLQDKILNLITVAVPAVIGAVSWMHHNRAKMVAARELASGSNNITSASV